MKIAIDARMYGESGIGRYIRNLISELQKLDNRNEYFLILLEKDFYSDTDELLKRLPRFASNDEKKDSGVTSFPRMTKVMGDFRWYTIREQIELPRILNKIKPDLVHFPHFNVPLWYGGKFIVTIHDLIHQHFQMKRVTTLDPFTFKLKQIGHKTIFKKAVKDSMKIFTPSQFVKKQLADEWNVNGMKIKVTPEAVDDILLSIDNKMNDRKINRVMEKFGIRLPYIFYIGNAHPHKNVEGLIKAFLKLQNKESEINGIRSASRTEILRSAQNDSGGELQLVLAGTDNYFWQKLKSSVISHQPSDIIFTGFVTDEELVALYKNAEAFVMPSFEEGFGIPLLEAMAVGCPVVSSNAGALKEVGGDAAIYFNPASPRHPERSEGSIEMAEKILEVLTNEKLREELIKKGMMRAKQFSWKKMAEQTLEVYKRCV